jgi:WS/DGAT/MGAT family acyltransferase
MTLDRLSALDESFLRLESDAAHMHVGWTLVVDGIPPPLDELRAHINARLEQLPRFRRRVLCSQLHLHDPVWVDDEQFDIRNHVDRVELPAPGGPAELRERAGALLSIQLDRCRPLWRLHLVEGLRDGGFAVVGQAHHALVDGIAAVEVALLLLDGDGSVRPGEVRVWSPRPAPGLMTRALSSAATRVRLGRAAASLASRAVINPGLIREGIAGLRKIGSALGAVGNATAPSALNRRIGPYRSVAFAELPLEAAKEIGRSRGATVNDIILTTSALALGRYLHRHGECQPWLRVFVPVSTRASGDGAELGNRISVVFVELPVGQRDPSAALIEVCRQTRALKRDGYAGSTTALLGAAALMPTPVRDACAWLLTRPQTFNAVVSNVPGPERPLYLLGRRVRGAFPAVPLAQGHGLSVGMLSYCGTLHVGLYADPNVIPDLVEVAHDFTQSFDALRFALAPRAPEPVQPGPQPIEPALV